MLLDFYADWCESCVAMDKKVLTQAEVKQALKKFVFLRVDLSRNTEQDENLMKYFKVIAPPNILFFGVEGFEDKDARIVGELSAQDFLTRLNFFYKKNCSHHQCTEIN